MKSEEREHFIRRRAYELWEAHGCRDGCGDDDWLRAEREFDGIAHDALLPYSLSAEAHGKLFGYGIDRAPEPSLRRFRVQFFKRLIGGDHHETDVCQWESEASAVDSEAALRAVEQEFCQSQGLQHRSLHADRHCVTLAGDEPRLEHG